MPPLDHARLAAAIAAGRFVWTVHVTERLAARGIEQDDALRVVSEGKGIADYPDDTPFPSALFLGAARDGRPLHVVAAYDAENDRGYIVTVYVPDPSRFEDDRETRRRDDRS